jgi:hypothetical protein
MKEVCDAYSDDHLATLALSSTVLAQAPASALPYDPYPWCATMAAASAEHRIAASPPGTSAWRQ